MKLCSCTLWPGKVLLTLLQFKSGKKWCVLRLLSFVQKAVAFNKSATSSKDSVEYSLQGVLCQSNSYWTIFWKWSWLLGTCTPRLQCCYLSVLKVGGKHGSFPSKVHYTWMKWEVECLKNLQSLYQFLYYTSQTATDSPHLCIPLKLFLKTHLVERINLKMTYYVGWAGLIKPVVLHV